MASPLLRSPALRSEPNAPTIGLAELAPSAGHSGARTAPRSASAIRRPAPSARGRSAVPASTVAWDQLSDSGRYTEPPPRRPAGVPQAAQLTSVDHKRVVVGLPRGRRARGATPASARVAKSHGTGAAKGAVLLVVDLIFQNIAEGRCGLVPGDVGEVRRTTRQGFSARELWCFHRLCGASARRAAVRARICYAGTLTACSTQVASTSHSMSASAGFAILFCERVYDRPAS